MSAPLDTVAREAREAPVPEPDWSRVEAKLFARVEAEAAAMKAAPRAQPAMANAWVPAAFGLAAAAAVALVLGSRGSLGARSPAGAQAPLAAVDRSAGTLVDGQAVVAGKPELPPVGVALGDVLEARGARAVFFRAASAGRAQVAFTLEDASRATVTGVDGPLVLSLEEGAVEAELGDDPSGAFAVDVGADRIESAFGGKRGGRGMHVRIARQLDFAIVDVSEGSVSIGGPSAGQESRLEAALGQLVSAPAHVEFVPGNAARTMRVDHTASSVRAPFAFGAKPVAEGTALRPATPLAQLAAPPPHAPLAAPPPALVAPAPAPQALSVDPSADATIAQAVRACLANRPASPDGVVVTVSTELDLRLNEDGTVQLARFSPPIAPEVQACATATIYRTRFAHGGTASINIESPK